MQRLHFETLQPVCPVCRAGDVGLHALGIAEVCKETQGHIIEGLLHCRNLNCQHEYPIIDGIPIIVRDVRSYLADNYAQICSRTDFSPIIESVIGDCCGGGSNFDAIRQQLSSYVWDHYGDLDPEETAGEPRPGSMLRVLERGLELTDTFAPNTGPMIDIGCSVGRSTFALAEKFGCPVLGIDLNFPMLRLAGQILRDGFVRYSRRRVGLVYDRREFSVSLGNRDQVDFWACDATALPLVDQKFGAAVSMNLLDCVHSPMEFLSSLAAVLKPDSPAVIACPYDWSVSATTVEGWLGGHSQRGPDAGASEPVLRRLLTPGQPQSIDQLQLIAEDNVPWHVRMHDRSVVTYTSHVVATHRSNTDPID